MIKTFTKGLGMVHLIFRAGVGPGKELFSDKIGPICFFFFVGPSDRVVYFLNRVSHVKSPYDAYSARLWFTFYCCLLRVGVY